MTVITNNHPRNTLYYHELTDKEREQFNYDVTESTFFRYKGNLFDIGEFTYAEPGVFTGWHGYSSDTFFSGLVIRMVNDGEQVVVGRYFA